MSKQDPKSKKTDYEVGRGKPPKSGQFKPGQSGNPKGRKKAQPTLAQEVEKELNRKVTIKEKGKSRRVPLRSIVAKQLVKTAAEGDLKALDRVNALQLDLQQHGKENNKPVISIAESWAILEEYQIQLGLGVDEEETLEGNSDE